MVESVTNCERDFVADIFDDPLPTLRHCALSGDEVLCTHRLKFCVSDRQSAAVVSHLTALQGQGQ